MDDPSAAVAVVCAYNEAPRIASVVRPLVVGRRVARVVVVNDGSTDGTADAAERAGATVLQLPRNLGKGHAMRVALDRTREAVVCFFDADLVGLCPEHADWLLDPVAFGAAGMCVGLMDYGAYNRVQTALPLISGQRAVRRDILRAVPEKFWSGFSIEAGINAAAERSGLPVVTCVLNGVSQVPKWHKVGVRRGIGDGVKMMVRVLRATRDARR